MKAASSAATHGSTPRLLAAASVLLYLLAYLMTGAGTVAPVLFGALGAIVGLASLLFGGSGRRMAAVVLCQAVMVSYPVTYVSPGVFGDTFVTLHFIAAVACAVAFVALTLAPGARREEE